MNNNVAKLTRYFSYAILVLGFIGGIVIGNVLATPDPYSWRDETIFNTFAMVVSWVSTLFAFFLFYVLSEIAELLQNLIDKTNSIKINKDFDDVFDKYFRKITCHIVEKTTTNTKDSDSTKDIDDVLDEHMKENNDKTTQHTVEKNCAPNSVFDEVFNKYVLNKISGETTMNTKVSDSTKDTGDV